MTEEEFIRSRIKQAREEMGLSQRDMAKLYGTSQSKISDLERGRVQITALQIIEFAKMLNKPISYFFPSDISKDTAPLEAKLLDIFRKLPEDWKERVLREVVKFAEVYQRVQPYVRAGISEDLLDVLISDEIQIVDLEEAAYDEGEYFDSEEYSQRQERIEEFLKKHPELEPRGWRKSSGDVGIRREDIS